MADNHDEVRIEMGAPRDQKPADVHTEMIEAVEVQAGGRDKAAQLLKEAGHSVTVTPHDNARILRKIDLAILPIIMIIYCLQSLDKTALSYASVFGLITEAHLHGQQYSWLGSIVYVAQLVFQPLVAYLLVKMPIGKFCAVMVLCWGATLCGMAASKNFGSLMATRFILGAFESSVAPTFIAIVQMWYRRSEQTNRNAAWYSMLGVVNILGSLLSYGLAHIQSKALYPYQIIFLFCGCLTVAFSIVIFLFLPDLPMQARFLRGDDKLLAIERLRMNQMGISSGLWRWDHVWECLTDVKTWLWFSMITAVSIPSGGISTFGPLIAASPQSSSTCHSAPSKSAPLLGGAFAATHWKMKSPILALLCIPPIIGCSILLSVAHDKKNRGVELFAYYITSVYPAITPLIYSWSGQNTAGDTKRKVTTAVLFVGASAGNILGPHLYTTAEAPRYARGLRSSLSLFVVIIVLVGIGAAWISVLNKRHEAARVRLGKAAKIVDLSMESKRTLGAHEEAVNDSQLAGGVGDKAFDDVTDLQNEDFVYLY